MTAKCPTRMQFSKCQSKGLLHPHNVPSFPRQQLGTDLFDYQGTQYLLVTDYYSKYPIVRKLNSSTSAAVINHLKSVFAEHGIAETPVSDNGLQYSSPQFAAFCKQWGIDHVRSSPLYPQSNGFIERSVQTVKNHLRKAEALGQDPYLALLTYRTTPVDRNLLSPAQLPNHRDYHTQLPWSGRLQCTQAFDSQRVQLKPINKIPPPSKEQVASNHDSLLIDEDTPKPSVPQFSPPVQSCQNHTNLLMTTRSGCIVKMPSRLDL